MALIRRAFSLSFPPPSLPSFFPHSSLKRGLPCSCLQDWVLMLLDGYPGTVPSHRTHSAGNVPEARRAPLKARPAPGSPGDLTKRVDAFEPIPGRKCGLQDPAGFGYSPSIASSWAERGACLTLSFFILGKFD